jgi:membrane protein XagC
VLFCVMALPFLIFALPAELVSRSAFNSLLVLLFPALFGFASFAYGNAVFEGDATMFVATLLGREPLPVPAANVFSALPHGALAWIAVAALAASTLVAAMPPALALAARARNVEGHARALAMLSGIALLVVVITWLRAYALDGTANPSTLLLAAAPFVAFGVVALYRSPVEPRRTATMTLLLGGAVLLGWLLPFPWVSGEPQLWREAALGAQVDRNSASDATGTNALAHYLEGRSDVLIDAHAHPALLARRNSTHGLVVPGDDAFTQTVVTQRVQAQFIAVPDPDAPTIAGDDLLAQTFPTLYQQGVHGYRLAYDANGWRVYERSDMR